MFCESTFQTSNHYYRFPVVDLSVPKALTHVYPHSFAALLKCGQCNFLLSKMNAIVLAVSGKKGNLIPFHAQFHHKTIVFPRSLQWLPVDYMWHKQNCSKQCLLNKEFQNNRSNAKDFIRSR